jgi:hypothetical protein
MNEREKATQDYIEKFGKKPNIIGMFWRDSERLVANLRDAIKTGEEYDEYMLLSESQRKKFDDGGILF